MSESTRVARINGKYAIRAACIGGACVIFASVIELFSTKIENKKLKEEYIEVVSENTNLASQTSESQEAYNSLNSQYESLISENSDMHNRISVLENELSQYSSLIEENNILNSQITELQEEIERLKEESSLPTSSPEILTGKKVNIFDLDTFKGEGYWFDLSNLTFSEEDFIDTYGNEYLNAHIGYHSATDKSATFTPIYLLDKKFSICEGQIAWSKTYKNDDGSAWIEFYSGNDCIYTTEPITADSRPLTFSFSVTDIEKLTIVRNGTSSGHSVNIIYPYLNLVE